MPIYEYRCRNGHTFEAIHSMTDDPIATCEQCAAPVERVFHPVAVHFKGSGFYTTDYARKGAAATGGDGGKEGEAKGDAGGEAKKPAAEKTTSASKGSKGSDSSD